MILEKYSEFNLPGPKILITPKIYFLQQKLAGELFAIFYLEQSNY